MYNRSSIPSSTSSARYASSARSVGGGGGGVGLGAAAVGVADGGGVGSYQFNQWMTQSWDFMEGARRARGRGGGGAVTGDGIIQPGMDQNLRFGAFVDGKLLHSTASVAPKVQGSRPPDHRNRKRAPSAVILPHKVRGLPPQRLAGVIFVCSNDTMKENIDKKLFGLTKTPHWEYVQHIRKGMPLFLYNYQERRFYGVFEAESEGRINIDPTAWANDSGMTQYSAQVRVLERRSCHPIAESDFKNAFPHLYFSPSRFMFELTLEEAEKLDSMFSSITAAQPPAAAAATSNFSRPNVATATEAWRRACGDENGNGLERGNGGGSKVGARWGSCGATTKDEAMEEEEEGKRGVRSGSETEEEVMGNGLGADLEREAEILLARSEMSSEKGTETEMEMEMLQQGSQTNSGVEEEEEEEEEEEVWSKLRSCSQSRHPHHTCLQFCIAALLQMRQDIVQLKQENLALRQLVAEQHPTTQSDAIEHQEVKLAPKDVEKALNGAGPPQRTEEPPTLHKPDTLGSFLNNLWRKT